MQLTGLLLKMGLRWRGASAAFNTVALAGLIGRMIDQGGGTPRTHPKPEA